MGTYKIFVDTSADMPEDLAKKLDIGIIRFMCLFDEVAYETGTELTNEEFYEKLEKATKIPTTSQTPYQTMYETIKDASDKYDTVIYLTISSKASGQFNTACMVKNQILEEDNKDKDIRIVDTNSFSVYISAAAVYLKELLDNGMGIDEALEKCGEYIRSWQCYILVDTLKYLEKGGRITKTSAIVGSLLDIKPVLTIKDGLVEPVEKLRGKKKIFKKLADLIEENENLDKNSKEFMIAHSNKEYKEEAYNALKEKFGIEELKMCLDIGPIVGTHIGPGALGILFRLKK